MARHRLTDTTVRNRETLPAPEKGNKIYYDTLVDGFGLRVTANDARSFILNYRTRHSGRERRYTIGSIDDWAAVKARDEARRLRTVVDSGGDPLRDIEEKRAAPTVSQLIDRYAAEHLPRKRPRSRIEDERLFPIIRDAIGRETVADIGFDKVDALHQRVTKERGPFRANRVLALLSKMFSLAIKWKMRPDNPCVGVERNYEPKRNRYLTGKELERLMMVLEKESDKQAADIIRMLLLTGARIAELLKAEWAQFDREPGYWIKPHTMTKQEEEHRLPLSDEALALLARLKAVAPRKAKFVFPGDSPFRPRTYDSFRSANDRIRKAAGITDVRPHDLRHSHASLLVNAGYSLSVIGAALGHKTPSTTARYAHLSDETLRGAVKSVGAKVVPMKPRAR